METVVLVEDLKDLDLKKGTKGICLGKSPKWTDHYLVRFGDTQTVLPGSLIQSTLSVRERIEEAIRSLRRFLGLVKY